MFFEILLEYIKELDNERIELQKLIITDLENFPHISIDKEKIQGQRQES